MLERPQIAHACGMGSIAAAALVAFLVVLVVLVGLRIADRHSWHPIDRIADVFTYGPSSRSSSSSTPALPAPPSEFAELENA